MLRCEKCTPETGFFAVGTHRNFAFFACEHEHEHENQDFGHFAEEKGVQKSSFFVIFDHFRMRSGGHFCKKSILKVRTGMLKK